jgi:hypothetical protein
MIGPKKLSTIYEELGAAMAAEKENPIVALDREIRKMKRKPRAAQSELRSLVLVRNALARAVKSKPVKGERRRTKAGKKPVRKRG